MKSTHEKAINEKFAEKHSLSIDEMNEKAQEIYDELDANQFANDDARWSRAYRRVRGAFRKKARSMTNAVDGMIVCRMTNKDFDRNQYDFAMRALEKNGKDFAISQGLVNDKGQPLYKWGNFVGKPILDENGEPGRPLASGRAIGYTFTKNDEGEYENIEPRYIIIGKQKTDSTIPVCQVGQIALSIADSKQNDFFADNNFAYYNDFALSNKHKAPYDYDEVQEILGQWNKAFGDHFTVIGDVNDLVKFEKDHSYSKDNKTPEFDFCVIPGVIVGITAGGKYSNAIITIEFVDYDTMETSIINIFVPEPMIKGLSMQEDDQGIFVLQAFEGKEQTRWHLGGFLHVDDSVDVEEFFGIALGDEEEDV